MPDMSLITPANNSAATRDHGTVVESASASAAALSKASVEARYIMAMRQPRSWDSVRIKILDACKRTSFAETARYSKPVGNKSIVGPSIRFAEEAARCMGNLLIDSAVVHEDSERRMVRVTVTDLEANLTYPQDIVVIKQVERKSPKEGQTILGQRMNSYNEPVFLVAASEDELITKQAALTSKTMRTGVLRILPGDILDEAMDRVVATLKAKDEQDPTAARKRLADGFHSMGVSPEKVADYLGHPLGESTPTEMQDLRQVFAALREGEATWPSIMETKRSGDKPKDPAPPKGTRAGKLEGLKKSAAGNAGDPLPSKPADKGVKPAAAAAPEADPAAAIASAPTADPHEAGWAEIRAALLARGKSEKQADADMAEMQGLWSSMHPDDRLDHMNTWLQVENGGVPAEPSATNTGADAPLFPEDAGWPEDEHGGR